MRDDLKDLATKTNPFEMFALYVSLVFVSAIMGACALIVVGFIARLFWRALSYGWNLV